MKDDDRIRFIFTRRRNFTRASAAAALDRSERWVERSRFARENGDVVEWEEMVLLAELRWTNLQIHRALGDEARRIFPPLQLLGALTVYLPKYKIIALRDLAHRLHRDVSEILTDPFGVYRDQARAFSRKVPGYWEAWRFPYLE